MEMFKFEFGIEVIPLKTITNGGITIRSTKLKAVVGQYPLRDFM